MVSLSPYETRSNVSKSIRHCFQFYLQARTRGFLGDVKTVLYSQYFLRYDKRARYHMDQVTPICFFHVYILALKKRDIFLSSYLVQYQIVDWDREHLMLVFPIYWTFILLLSTLCSEFFQCGSDIFFYNSWSNCWWMIGVPHADRSRDRERENSLLPPAHHPGIHSIYLDLGFQIRP